MGALLPLGSAAFSDEVLISANGQFRARMSGRKSSH
jgi:hypothetical protein